MGELSRLFKDNKDTLNNKKKEEKEIDERKSKLDKINEEKEKEDNIGEAFLDEEEFELITSLKSLKNTYRSSYEYLQNLRSDFAYCENMVKLSREKLLSEFETWYTDSFGVPKLVGHEKPDEKYTRSLPKDEGEKFENVQKELLMQFPESVAFYNARISTDRRKLYNRSSVRERPALPSINSNLPTRTMVAS